MPNPSIFAPIPPKRAFAIHPGIGVARLGNSPDSFVGPETPGVDANWDDAAGRFKSFRDAQGRILRQGARFRVFEYFWDEANRIWGNPREVSLWSYDVADIQWRVHLANRKASFYVFDGVNGSDDNYVARSKMPAGEQIKTDPDRTNLRNADVLPGDRAAMLEIDPGEQLLSVRKGGSVEVNNRNPNIPIKSLGTLQLDNARLVVLGGYGQTETTGGVEMQEYASNDKWFDDASDGPVKARIIFKDGTWADAEAAWVMVGPPDYAPGIGNVVTLYDTLLDIAVRKLPIGSSLGLTGTALKVNELQKSWEANAGQSLQGYKPSFLQDIYPLLKRAFGARDVHVSGVTNAKYHMMLTDWVKLAALDGPQAKEAKSLREYIFNYMRNPDAKAIEWKKMPRGHGDNYRDLEKFGDGELDRLPEPNSVFSLTRVQYAILREWAAGSFVNDWPGAEPKITASANPTPDQLDKAAADSSVGGPFYPGIDCSWLIRAPEVYSSPFRFQAPPQPAGELEARPRPLRVGAVDFRPGFFSQQMALPWQADFYDCQKERHEDDEGNEYYFMWWTAQRPDDVFPSKGEKQVRWTRLLDSRSKNPEDPDDYHNYDRFVQMLKGWPELKFISVRNGDHWEEEGEAEGPATALQTGDVIALQADNGLYLSRINRGNINPIEAAKSSIDVFSQFRVTVLPDKSIALQADNGQFLSRINRGGINPIEAAKGSIDVFSQFKVTIRPDNSIALQADNGQFLSRINRGGINPIEAAKGGVDPYSQFKITRIKVPEIERPATALQTGDLISLQAENGQYLTRIVIGCTNPIEAAKSSVDVSSQFRVTVLPDKTIALQADNGQFLSRIYRGNLNFIEAEKSGIDVYSQFRVTVLPNNCIALQADNGLFLSRIYRGNTNFIEAAKGAIDAYSQFKVTRLKAT